jgi:hypothetical protein
MLHASALYRPRSRQLIAWDIRLFKCLHVHAARNSGATVVQCKHETAVIGGRASAANQNSERLVTAVANTQVKQFQYNTTQYCC